jgi:APA family basic amino acid/polyamine antiporter
LLVFQMGQPRIWMSMSRDGLLPKVFQKIHPKYQTPSFATIVTGLVVGIPILFTDKTFVLDFTSIATLFAFVLVCGGVLLIPRRPKEAGKFNLPYVNSQFIFPVLVVIAVVLIHYLVPTYFATALDFSEGKLATTIPLLLFFVLVVLLSVVTFVKKLSLIPLLGLISCCYLLTGMTISNWLWFGMWLFLGLIFYFSFGYKNSKLNQES